MAAGTSRLILVVAWILRPAPITLKQEMALSRRWRMCVGGIAVLALLGTYHFECVIHPDMDGTITVTR